MFPWLKIRLAVKGVAKLIDSLSLVRLSNIHSVSKSVVRVIHFRIPLISSSFILGIPDPNRSVDKPKGVTL